MLGKTLLSIYFDHLLGPTLLHVWDAMATFFGYKTA